MKPDRIEVPRVAVNEQTKRAFQHDLRSILTDWEKEGSFMGKHKMELAKPVIIHSPRTWKEWWSYCRRWLWYLKTDIERWKQEMEDSIEPWPWRMIYGTRITIDWKRNTTRRMMPLMDIYDFTVGNFKKVIYGTDRNKTTV